MAEVALEQEAEDFWGRAQHKTGEASGVAKTGFASTESGPSLSRGCLSAVASGNGEKEEVPCDPSILENGTKVSCRT